MRIAFLILLSAFLLQTELPNDQCWNAAHRPCAIGVHEDITALLDVAVRVRRPEPAGGQSLDDFIPAWWQGDAVGSFEDEARPDDTNQWPEVQDVELLARTVFGEARGQGDEEVRAVAHIAINRWLSGKWGQQLGQVVKWPAQFSSWNAWDPNFHVVNDPHVEKRRGWRRVNRLTVQVLAERLSGATDATGGCMYFWHPRSMKPAGAPPWWSRGTVERQIGQLKCVRTASSSRPAQTPTNAAAKGSAEERAPGRS